MRQSSTRASDPNQGLLFEVAIPTLPPKIRPRKVAERFPHIGFEIQLTDNAYELPIAELSAREKIWKAQKLAAQNHTRAAKSTQDPPDTEIPRGPYLVKSFEELKDHFMPNSRLRTELLWDPQTTTDPRKQAIGLAQLEFFEYLFADNQKRPSRWVLQGPTSAGKSYIALTAIEHALSCQKFGGKPVIITPDKDLIEQLVRDAEHILGLGKRQIGLASSAVSAETRGKRWLDPTKLFHIYTPGTFWNDLRHNRINSETLPGQVILDECHHYFDGFASNKDREIELSPSAQVYARIVETLASKPVHIIAMSATPGPKGARDIDDLRTALASEHGEARYFPMNLPPHKFSAETRFVSLDNFGGERYDHILIWCAIRLLEGARYYYHRVIENLGSANTEESLKLADRLHKMCVKSIKLPEVFETEEDASNYVFGADLQRTFEARPIDYFLLPAQGPCIKFCEQIAKISPPPEMAKWWHTVVMDAWRLEHYRRLHAKLTCSGISATLVDLAACTMEVKYGLSPQELNRPRSKHWRGPSPTKLQIYDAKQATMADARDLSFAMTVFRYLTSGCPRLDRYNLPLKDSSGQVLDPSKFSKFYELLRCDTLEALKQRVYPNITAYTPSTLARQFLKDALEELSSQGLTLKDHPKTDLAIECFRNYFRSGRLGKLMIKTNFVDHGNLILNHLPKVLSELGIRNAEVSFIEGKMSHKERRETLNRFHRPCREDGKVRILVVCKLASEGRHDPEVDWFVCMQPFWNFKTVKQGGGRTGRDPSGPRKHGRTALDSICLGHVISFVTGPGSEDFRRDMAAKSSTRKIEKEYQDYNRAAILQLQSRQPDLESLQPTELFV